MRQLTIKQQVELCKKALIDYEKYRGQNNYFLSGADCDDTDMGLCAYFECQYDICVWDANGSPAKKLALAIRKAVEEANRPLYIANPGEINSRIEFLEMFIKKYDKP